MCNFYLQDNTVFVTIAADLMRRNPTHLHLLYFQLQCNIYSVQDSVCNMLLYTQSVQFSILLFICTV